MNVNQHMLVGCAPAPLAHYLKALGVLRLIAEQKDAKCRGAWRDDHFVLATTVTKAELERFFLAEYVPTAFVSPWNKGSGFFIADDPGLSPIERSNAPRLGAFRDGIADARRLLTELAAADATVRSIKDEPKKLPAKAREALKKVDEYRSRLAAAERLFRTLKANLIPECRLTWRGSHLDWMNAAMVLNEDCEPSYPALLGTGGNDGRLDFTNNLMQRLAELFDVSSEELNARPGTRERLEQSLWAIPSSAVAAAVSIGQYLPGGAGGANSTTGASGDPLVNAWDFVLMLEGAVLFVPSATRRLGPSAAVQASAPFALRSQATGGGTFQPAEESGRGEQWLPLWNRYASYAEVRRLLEEGRAQVGRRSAARPIDMARAVTRLGTARGITGFQRYAYLERNGQSNFAVPLGRIPVGYSPWAQLVDDLESWLERLMRAARDAAPARLIHAEQRLNDAVFAALTHDHNPRLWQDALIAAARMEAIQSSGLAVKVGALPLLKPRWLLACDDNSSMFRLAVALGGAFAPYSNDRRRGGSIRHHFLPLKPGSRSYLASDDKISRDVRVVATGREPLADLIAIVERRLVEAQQGALRHPQILPRSAAGSPNHGNTGAYLTDISEWLNGSVDEGRCLDLARAFMALDWGEWSPAERGVSLPINTAQPDEAWATLRLCTLAFPLSDEHDVPFDPEILGRLKSGNIFEAFRLARLRLLSHGIHPTVRSALVDSQFARRWASALAFPITQATARRLLAIVQPGVS